MNGLADIAILDSLGVRRAARVLYSLNPEEGEPSSVTLCLGDSPPQSAVGDDLFDALCNLRLQLEAQHIQLCVAGAEVNVYPSTLSRQMGGGRMAYIMAWRPVLRRIPFFRRFSRKLKLVDIFADVPCDRVGSVEEQQAFFDAWIKGK